MNRVVALALLLTSLPLLADASAHRFPDVTGRNLHGDEIRFPAAFAERRCTLAIVAYEQKQQEVINPWLPKLIELAKAEAGFDFYELPTIAKMNRVMRWVIYRGMRSGIKDGAGRSRTVTFHIDKEPFNEALGIRNEKQIHLLLVDAKGKVLWRETGSYSDAKFGRLKEAVKVGAGE